MNRLLRSFLGSAIKKGALEIVDAKGRAHRFGDGSEPTARVRFRTPAVQRAITTNPELRLGEAYMDGDLVLEHGDIYDFLDVLAANLRNDRAAWMTAIAGARYVTRRIRQHNTRRRARRNVAHHYDLDSTFYRLFLDSDRQYSCAYFEAPDSDLESAQLAKKRHLAAKMVLREGDRVLDIGSGWGGLGLYLADMCDVDVTGVTLSEEQHKISTARAHERGLEERTHFHLRDYRTLSGPFDRIVSVGMFEHVGIGHYREYFAKCRELLTDDGVMVLHSIGRSDGPGETNSWIQKYIFPGGYIPALSEVIPVIEKEGLVVTDVEILRLHYAETLRAWRKRFLERWDEAAELYDERFCRMWEFYLAASEVAFRYQDLMVFQIQLVRDQTAVPLTRGYIDDAERALRDKENERRPFRLAGE